jgi:hypothetical protein
MKYLKTTHVHKTENEKTFFIPETSISLIEFDGKDYKIYLNLKSEIYSYANPFKTKTIELVDTFQNQQ